LFNPAETGLRDTVAKALLTDVLLLNTSLRMDSLQKLERLKLDYNQTNLVIEFSALNYDKLNKLDYHYQLTGFDTGWVKSNSRHQAVYTYLPPGPYTFKVKTKNVAGVFTPETILLNLRVYPPFWRSWWFYLLVLFLLATVLYLLYRERIERLVTLHSIRSEIAGHLHQDVSLTLNNINVLSQIAKLKADKDIMRSKELIDEISGKSYNMMLSMDEILWSIDPVNDTMEKTLLRLSEFARTQETNYGISIDLVIHQKVKALRLHMKLRHDFFIVCKEALQSLAQASQYKSITVDIDLVWSKILLKILSVGDEASTETASLLELRENMKRKAAHMHASLTFETGRRDASIILSIPVK
jgi:glucose-6-phosphate-specific signal transduction histidine kinase